MEVRKLMPNETTKHVFGAMLPPLLAALALLVPGPTRAADSLAEEAARFLPSGAVLATMAQMGPGGLAQSGPGGKTLGVPAVAAGQVVSPTSDDIAFVYKIGDTLFLRVVNSSSGAALTPDVSLPGTYVSYSSAYGVSHFTPVNEGVLLRDVAGLGREQVLVTTSNGASIGDYLSIFAAEDGVLTSLDGSSVIGGNNIRLDCGQQPPCTIVSFGKWTDLTSATVAVYNWLGSAFVQTDKGADHYLSARLAELAESAATDEPAAALGRASEAMLAVSEYLPRKEYDAAQSLCRTVLDRLSDPSKAIAPPPQKGINANTLSANRLRQAKAIAHDLLARIYEAQGLQTEAAGEHRLAQALRTGGSDQ
jgi:hypothetical protein